MLVGLYSIPGWADSPHYLKAAASFDAGTACYSVALKEAGLGNSGSGPTQITYALTCTATFTASCFNNGGNEIQGTTKTGSGTATAYLTVPVLRNGSTTGTIAICPASFDLGHPGCTDGQELAISAASYSGCGLSDGLGVSGAASPTLPTLGGTDLFVPVD